MAWRSNVRFALFVRQRKKIADRIFIARNSTCSAVLQVKKLLSDVKVVKLISVEMKTTEKDVFIDQQNAFLAKAIHQFEDSLRVIIREVQVVLTTVKSVHGNATKLSETFADESGDPVKAKSLVQLREEKNERKIAKQRARFEIGSLPDFIRFVDYLVIETLVGMTVQSIQYFYDELLKSRKTGIKSFEEIVLNFYV